MPMSGRTGAQGRECRGTKARSPDDETKDLSSRDIGTFVDEVPRGEALPMGQFGSKEPPVNLDGQHEHVALTRDGRRPIVVGVSTDGRAASAVIWAAAETERTGRTLRLVSAHETESSSQRQDLASLARQLTLRNVEHVTRVGSPARVIIEAAESAALTVVGRRGMSRLRRTMVGGTSLIVATEAPCPVVMVPEEWTQPAFCSAPIVLGIAPPDRIQRTDPDEDPELQVIEFAFERADSMRVPLVVVSAWSLPPAYLHSPAAPANGRHESADDLERRLAAWRHRYPRVEVHTDVDAVPPVDALLAAGRDAQLTVVGRYSGTRPPSGGLGSVTRGMIRRAHHPVAVIPRRARLSD